MKFSEVIEGLKEGRSFTRGAWMAEAINDTTINYKVKHSGWHGAGIDADK